MLFSFCKNFASRDLKLSLVEQNLAEHWPSNCFLSPKSGNKKNFKEQVSLVTIVTLEARGGVL